MATSSAHEVDALVAALRAIEKETGKALKAELKQTGEKVAAKVRSSQARPYRTGRLRRSVKTSATAKGSVSIYSNLPYAPVWEWGGEIKPRGVPIHFPRTEFVTGTVDAMSKEVEPELAAAFDAAARRNGFH
jgi:hypothetical protein